MIRQSIDRYKNKTRVTSTKKTLKKQKKIDESLKGNYLALNFLINANVFREKRLFKVFPSVICIFTIKFPFLGTHA